MLYWLHRFGYLTAPQVAALVYPKYRQGEHLARRVLLRLERRGFPRETKYMIFGSLATFLATVLATTQSYKPLIGLLFICQTRV